MNEIWSNYVLPYLTSAGLIGMALGAIYMLVKLRMIAGLVVLAAAKAAEQTVNGCRGKFTLDTQEIVNSILTTRITPLEEWQELYCKSQTAMAKLLSELSQLWASSPYVSKEQQARIENAVQECYDITKTLPKSVPYKIESEPEKKPDSLIAKNPSKRSTR